MENSKEIENDLIEDEKHSEQTIFNKIMSLTTNKVGLYIFLKFNLFKQLKNF